MKHFIASTPPSERGYVSVTVALLLVVMLGFAALAVDSGVLYSSRTSAQRIADAAALAGAASFVLEPTALQPDTARQKAREFAVGREILGQAVENAEVTVNVDVANRLVTVSIDRTEDTYLGRALGLDSAGIDVTAEAEASTRAVGSNCTRPWFVPNTIFLPPGSTPCDACDPTSPDYAALQARLLVRNGIVTPFASAPVSSGGALGAAFTIKPQRPNQALQPGQFFAIRIGGGGGDVYRENIGACSQLGSIGCANCYQVESGDMDGPTRQGVRDLIGASPDDFNGLGCYGPDCSDTSRSLIPIPIWDVCELSDGVCPSADFCPAGVFGPSAGATIWIKVKAFAMVFVEGISGQETRVRLVNVVPCQPGGGGNGGGSNVFAVPVRLVHTNADG